MVLKRYAWRGGRLEGGAPGGGGGAKRGGGRLEGAPRGGGGAWRLEGRVITRLVLSDTSINIQYLLNSHVVFVPKSTN